MDEVATLFHEFGHGLHDLLNSVRYESQGGTDVKQDFVELPSQIMGHWASEPEVLKSWARHIDTGEPIPDELIATLETSEHFNRGFEAFRGRGLDAQPLLRKREFTGGSSVADVS